MLKDCAGCDAWLRPDGSNVRFRTVPATGLLNLNHNYTIPRADSGDERQFGRFRRVALR
jgi:hypothetical protein